LGFVDRGWRSWPGQVLSNGFVMLKGRGIAKLFVGKINCRQGFIRYFRRSQTYGGICRFNRVQNSFHHINRRIFGLEIYFFVGDHPNAGFGGSLLIISLPIIIVLFLISTFVRKVIIFADSIVNIRMFGRREILTSNVKGFREKNNGIIIEPLLPTTSKIVIYAVDQPGNCGDLVNWLRENFID